MNLKKLLHLYNDGHQPFIFDKKNKLITIDNRRGGRGGLGYHPTRMYGGTLTFNEDGEPMYIDDDTPMLMIDRDGNEITDDKRRDDLRAYFDVYVPEVGVEVEAQKNIEAQNKVKLPNELQLFEDKDLYKEWLKEGLTNMSDAKLKKYIEDNKIVIPEDIKKFMTSSGQKREYLYKYYKPTIKLRDTDNIKQIQDDELEYLNDMHRKKYTVIPQLIDYYKRIDKSSKESTKLKLLDDVVISIKQNYKLLINNSIDIVYDICQTKNPNWSNKQIKEHISGKGFEYFLCNLGKGLVQKNYNDLSDVHNNEDNPNVPLQLQKYVSIDLYTRTGAIECKDYNWSSGIHSDICLQDTKLLGYSNSDLYFNENGLLMSNELNGKDILPLNNLGRLYKVYFNLNDGVYEYNLSLLIKNYIEYNKKKGNNIVNLDLELTDKSIVKVCMLKKSDILSGRFGSFKYEDGSRILDHKGKESILIKKDPKYFNKIT